jgi:hypothetical protein
VPGNDLEGLRCEVLRGVMAVVSGPIGPFAKSNL